MGETENAIAAEKALADDVVWKDTTDVDIEEKSLADDVVWKDTTDVDIEEESKQNQALKAMKRQNERAVAQNNGFGTNVNACASSGGFCQHDSTCKDPYSAMGQLSCGSGYTCCIDMKTKTGSAVRVEHAVGYDPGYGAAGDLWMDGELYKYEHNGDCTQTERDRRCVFMNMSNYCYCPAKAAAGYEVVGLGNHAITFFAIIGALSLVYFGGKAYEKTCSSDGFTRLDMEC